MLKDLIVRHENDTLLIDATYECSRWEVLIGALVAAGAIDIFLYRFVGTLSLVIIAVVIFAGSVYFGRQREDVELRVTENEMHFSSRMPHVMCCEYIRWLEYQEDASGPEHDHPEGLYAVLKLGNVCLLANASREQTHIVIDKIEATFPGLRNRWKQQTPFGEHFTTLGLDK